jgi:hypothetical protein
MRHRPSAILVAALLACDDTPRMGVERTTVATGEDVVVSFQDPLTGNATNQYWIALQPAGAPASDTTGRIACSNARIGRSACVRARQANSRCDCTAGIRRRSNISFFAFRSRSTAGR